ncbi:MAG: aminotransferase class V-fold PLP-dependent enzyme [Elusimicrobia bacterium]|nr:aminotransferase class V-fold PLP-dependent enzyme [Elusimicrobiota bacterium]
MTISTAKPAFAVDKIRREFPALEREFNGKKLVYLDSACTALKSRGVAEAVSRFYETLGACGGKRSTHLLAQAVEAELIRARQAAADFLNAESPNEIVFTSGTTEAVNLVARAFPYDERREVVLTDLEHNAVFLPFYEAARRGEIELKFCRSRDGRIEPDDMVKLVGDKTALVAITHASNVAGGTQGLAEIRKLAHGRGARLFVDDAQFVSSHREDVRTLNADFVAFSAHKIGGPFGLGVLYGREVELNSLRHYKVGGGTVKSVRWDGKGMPEVTYLDAPMRFEAGVANFAAFPGLTEAIRFLRAIPEAPLREHVSSLVRRAAEGLARIPEVKVLGRRDDLSEGSLVSFYPVHKEFSVADFNLFLNHELGDRFVALRAGEHCAHLLHQSLKLDGTVRLSFFAYNTAEEVDLFLDGLKSYAKEACA